MGAPVASVNVVGASVDGRDQRPWISWPSRQQPGRALADDIDERVLRAGDVVDAGALDSDGEQQHVVSGDPRPVLENVGDAVLVALEDPCVRIPVPGRRRALAHGHQRSGDGGSVHERSELELCRRRCGEWSPAAAPAS